MIYFSFNLLTNKSIVIRNIISTSRIIINSGTLLRGQIPRKVKKSNFYFVLSFQYCKLDYCLDKIARYLAVIFLACFEPVERKQLKKFQSQIRTKQIYSLQTPFLQILVIVLKLRDFKRLAHNFKNKVNDNKNANLMTHPNESKMIFISGEVTDQKKKILDDHKTRWILAVHRFP